MIVLGLENIFIIVKAVMSTPEEFEVKQRIAAGLSKEGRAISRNLSTLLLMLSMGMVFFNYTMKVSHKVAVGIYYCLALRSDSLASYMHNRLFAIIT